MENVAGKGMLSRKKKYIKVVQSKDQADLVVEIVGRVGGLSFLRGDKSICFNLAAGPKVKASVLEKIPKEWPAKNFESRCWRSHSYKPEEPYLQLFISDRERWYDVADWLTEVVDNLAKEYHDLLKPGSTS